MLLNADLGEHFGHWYNDNDQKIMPYIDQANIACGYHAGDAFVMQETLSCTKQHKVAVGAHVSYPDLQGFGRRSMQVPRPQLISMIHAQIAVLEGMAACQQQHISHIKPHGALYNDMMQSPTLFETVLQAISRYNFRNGDNNSRQIKTSLMLQALADNTIQAQLAGKYNVPLIYEAFADRAYDENGFLVSRTLPNALLTESQAMAQVSLMLENGTVKSVAGTYINIRPDSICVHSDSPSAIAMCAKISDLIRISNKP